MLFNQILIRKIKSLYIRIISKIYRIKNLIIYFFVKIFYEGKIKNKKYDGGGYYFVSNMRTFERIRYASKKEPMTQNWIRKFRQNSTLWDIGANVGIFTFLAAKLGNKVVSFEPLYANYYHLCKTLELNPSLSSEVIILPLALCSSNGIKTQSTLCTEAGYSGAQFGRNIGPNGEDLSYSYKSNILGLNGNNVTKLLDEDFANPDHVKIDVDGIEIEILTGLKEVFKKKNVKSVLIEAQDSSEEVIITEFLLKYEFALLSKEETVRGKISESCNLLFTKNGNKI